MLVITQGGCVFAHGLADGELLHVPLLLARCSHAGTGYHSSINPICLVESVVIPQKQPGKTKMQTDLSGNNSDGR